MTPAYCKLSYETQLSTLDTDFWTLENRHNRMNWMNACRSDRHFYNDTWNISSG